MVTFALVHGSQHGVWCWERLVPALEGRGHRAIAMDLPCDDPAVGLDGYARTVVDALAEGGGSEDEDVVVVGHSLGSLTIPLVARRRPVGRLVFLSSVPTGPGPAIEADLAAMITPQFAAAGRVVDEQDRESLDPAAAIAVWYHDCTASDAAWAVARLRPQSRRPLVEPSPLDTWPDVPMTVVLGRDERCVNLTWAVDEATRRTGTAPTLIGGGHSPFLSRPDELAALLHGIVTN